MKQTKVCISYVMTKNQMLMNTYSDRIKSCKLKSVFSFHSSSQKPAGEAEKNIL